MSTDDSTCDSATRARQFSKALDTHHQGNPPVYESPCDSLVQTSYVPPLTPSHERQTLRVREAWPSERNEIVAASASTAAMDEQVVSPDGPISGIGADQNLWDHGAGGFQTDSNGLQLDAWPGNDFWLTSDTLGEGLGHGSDRNGFFGRAMSPLGFY